jgi:hypothetical protein
MVVVSTAFDLFGHDLLILKLKHYGIRGTLLQWRTSSLANSTQTVKANYTCSNAKLISAGVPKALFSASSIHYLC